MARLKVLPGENPIRISSIESMIEFSLELKAVNENSSKTTLQEPLRHIATGVQYVYNQLRL
jgi:hypothetical protein